MQVVALVESLEHVCCRYRLAAFQPSLARAGHVLRLAALPRHWWSRLRLFTSLRRAEAVVLQRKLLQPWQLSWLRKAAPRLLFDFDDAVALRDSYATRGRSLGRERRFAATIRAVDVVVAGNPFLGEQARAVTGAARVEVVPTCVDSDTYPVAEHRRTDAGVQLVWIGSSSTLSGLELAQPLIEEIGQRLPGLSLKLICDRSLPFRQLPVHFCPWAQTLEATELAMADIGISWVPNDPWSRGKCGLKVLQYMAAGLPVVANRVGVQEQLVRHGENGFLAGTPDEWVKAIGSLARDPQLRLRMGQAGRRRVDSEFSVAAGAARWVRILNELERGRRAA